MTAWWEGPLLGFDIETTSNDPEVARIVSATIIYSQGPGRADQQWDWLIDPGVEIPEEVSAIHGITTADVRANGEQSLEAVQSICAVLNLYADVPWVGFNASFDFTVLDRECRRYKLQPIVPMPVIDPHVIDKKVDQYRKGKRTLTAVVAQYNGAPFEAHDAAADVRAALWLARVIPRRVEGAPEDARAVHALQIQWRKEQAAGLQDYFRMQGDPEAVVDGRWPVIPAENY